ncbi:UNVERIFIED_CONTAM: hypothetical protein O8I53_13195 [Campylobacter lari]
MSKFKSFIRGTYIHLILLLVYIPLFFAVVFSFNKATEKGFLSTT